MKTPLPFPYDQAFARNLGLLTDWEQTALRGKRVAIAGLGGVGGVHLLTLARLGIGAFTIADADKFELVNFNRQIGATVATIGRDKTEVLAEMAYAINPELRLRRFDLGVSSDTIDDFLDGADLFVDGLDFFELAIRRQIFARCAALNIPAVTAAPIGMGVAFLAFRPRGMSFEDYFRFEGQTPEEQYLRFLIGLSPRILASGYLVDPTRVDLQNRRGPSSVAACQLCAGVTAVASLKLLLGRAGLQAAPYNYQFDTYVGRYHVTKLRFGNAGPVQRLKLFFARRWYGGPVARLPPPVAEQPRTPLEEILNLALWAPSGDNDQPWSFRIIDTETVRVRFHHDTDNIYEYREGEPVFLAVGMLIETLRIAATGWGREMVWEPHDPRSITIRLQPAPTVSLHPLFSCITQRSVDRHAYRHRRLSADEKSILGECVNSELSIDWHEGTAQNLRMARLSAMATGIRLRSPEAFGVHKRALDWTNRQSPTGIPVRAAGLWPISLPLMRWAMERWERMVWLNRLGGAASGSVQMDYLPGLRTGAWFIMRHKAATGSSASHQPLIGMGQAVQRFWLTAAKLGLALQPAMAIVIFGHYGQHEIPFTKDIALTRRAASLAASFRHVSGHSCDEVVFMGRIGEPYPRLPLDRSVRRPLKDLMEPQEE